MLYQYNDDKSPCVVRFGSKGLTRWQQSYGPTKLELLGLVTAVMDCASYLRDRHFVAECDHQALKPLFQKKLKGQIYERWLAILQQFDIDIVYKPAADMVVPDALSRNPEYLEVLSESPAEDDPYFPYVQEKPTGVRLLPEERKCRQENNEVNKVSVLPGRVLDNHLYDADTEDNIVPVVAPSKSRVRFHKTMFRQRCMKKRSSDIYRNKDSRGNSVGANSEVQDHSRSIDSTPLQTIRTEDDGVIPVGMVNHPSQTEVPLLRDVETGSETENQLSDNSKPQHNAEVKLPEVPVEVESEVDVSAATVDQGDTDVQFPDVPIQIESEDNVAAASEDQPGVETVTLQTALNDLDMTAASIHDVQYADPDLRPIMDYLLTGNLPQSQVKSRQILLQQSDYMVIDGVLYYSRTSKAKRTGLMCQYQLVLPKALIQTVLKLYHDSPLGAHSGIQNTVDRIRVSYYCSRLAQIVSDYIRSCEQCQRRKVAKLQTKNAIVSYPTPCEPFSAWQIDLYGSLPTTAKGNSYVFTAVDMYTKFLYAKPIPSKDATTVAEVLFELFTQYGTCDTLISDQGSEFMATVTTELCKMLQIQQQFTPSFVHHCLGACERQHHTLATRLTHYVNARCNDWDQQLPTVVFSMNNSVNASLGYSPFEVLYGQRPKFPLCPNIYQLDLKSAPKDIHEYLVAKEKTIQTVREDAKSHVEKANIDMVARKNEKAKMLQLTKGDYVYLYDTATGAAKKLQNCYSGPYVVTSVVSPHMVLLLDPQGKKSFKQPIHIDRLKLAAIRQSEPLNFFKVVTREPETIKVSTASQTSLPVEEPVSVVQEKDSVQTPQMLAEEQAGAEAAHNPVEKPLGVSPQEVSDSVQSSGGLADQQAHTMPVQSQKPGDIDQVESIVSHRPKREAKKPARYKDFICFEEKDSNTYLSSEEDGRKVKRVLAQKNTSEGKRYLIHYVGEPSQNAHWVRDSSLPLKTRKLIKTRPPPLV